MPTPNTRSDQFDLSGKVALITGGSYGLGVVWAEALARAGADIALTARSADLLEQVATELRNTGRNVSIHPGDVTSETDVERVVAEAASAHGHIDVLVNNAGVSENTGRSSEQTSSEHFRHAVDVDLLGVWNYARVVGIHMLQRGSGSIVNIASICGMGATEFTNPAYHASKAAVIGLTRQLAAEWADRGVRVNAISPGFFMSEMVREALEMMGTRPWIDSRNPMRRMGEHHELTGPIVFLASDAASYVTGINLPVDGGHSTIIGSNQLQAPWQLWNQPGPVRPEANYGGLVELPPSIPRVGVRGFHYPVDEP
jgi:NAD(P)-dependent dehydrogenase (short-subunit alcohol dehydrogenase family)